MKATVLFASLFLASAGPAMACVGDSGCTDRPRDGAATLQLNAQGQATAAERPLTPSSPGARVEAQLLNKEQASACAADQACLNRTGDRLR